MCQINIDFIPEKWRKLALFLECPKRHFSPLQTRLQIGILQSAVRYVRRVWLAGGAEPGAIFRWGDASELQVSRSALARGERDISLQWDVRAYDGLQVHNRPSP
jgi:hypothetical protein